MMSKILLFLVLSGLTMACDPHRMRKCEWYLVPEPDHRHLVEAGWVSLCARNYVSKKQRCYFRAPLQFAEDIYGKTFRMSDMEFERKPVPRRVLSVKLCDPD